MRYEMRVSMTKTVAGARDTRAEMQLREDDDDNDDACK